MKKCRFLVVYLFTLLIFGIDGVAQNRATTFAEVQPKIIIIPFTREGEDIRTILEQDVNRRIAITKIKEGFDGRGYTTIDFVARLKAAQDNSVFTSDNQSDIKSQIIDLSGADVYVQAEINSIKSESGNSVILVLTAYETSTGKSLANKVGESNKFYTDDIAKLASRAVENCVQDFLNVMQSRFTEIVKTGRSVVVDIGFDSESQHKMSSEMGPGGIPLSDQIEHWVEANSFKNTYHIQGTTDVKMIFDDVRIPLKDPVNGNSYSPNKFALELFKFFKGLDMSTVKDVKNNTIYITIK